MNDSTGNWNGIDAAFLERLVTKAPTIRRRTDPTPPPTAAVKETTKSAPVLQRTSRDTAAARVGTIAAVDMKHRVSLQRVLGHLSWSAQTELVTELTAEGVVIRDRTTTDGALVGEAHLDIGGRLLLTPPVRAALDLFPGERVHAVALPTLGQVRLYSERDVLAALTGPIDETITPVRTTTPSTTSSPATRVRKARYAA